MSRNPTNLKMLHVLHSSLSLSPFISVSARHRRHKRRSSLRTHSGNHVERVSSRFLGMLHRIFSLSLSLYARWDQGEGKQRFRRLFNVRRKIFKANSTQRVDFFDSALEKKNKKKFRIRRTRENWKLQPPSVGRWRSFLQVRARECLSSENLA